jgi:Uma2 family endonuclease
MYCESMASLPNHPAYRAVEVREFLDMDFGDAKAELVDGMIWMMAGGSPKHAAVAANIIIALGTRLRGSGCRPYGSDLAMRTGKRSIRFPDVSVYCGNPASRDNDDKKLLGDPVVVFEVLSPSTASNDQISKLAEYRALSGVQAIVFVDPDTERVRVIHQDGSGDWLPQGADVMLSVINVTLPYDEIFARD